MSNFLRTLSFAVAIATGAFLVFQVQPIVSKRILPWFGGSPAVWTTCMLFFQVVLFGGYLYAHALTRWLSPRRQGMAHTVLVCGALLALPILPDASWKPLADDEPSLRILMLLAATVGLPYFVLAATGPLMQAWFSHVTLGRSPYRFFALSNLGSLLALLSYPLLLEPAMPVAAQGVLWTLLFTLYALACGTCVWQLWQRGAHSNEPSPVVSEKQDDADAPSRLRTGLWLVLPALASVMLLATTNHVCQNLPATPFLWVVPLSLYLSTFIISFDNERWYVRPLFGAGGLATCFLLSLRTRDWFAQLYLLEIAVSFAALFCVCMLCHGELARLKPSPRRLTLFYMLCSAGGALGGVLVAVICPWLFSSYFELNACNALGFALAGWVLADATGILPSGRNGSAPLGTNDIESDIHRTMGSAGAFPSRPGDPALGSPSRAVPLRIAGVGLLGLGVLLMLNAEFVRPAHSATDAARRNFYGVVSIRSDATDRPGERLIAMVHGHIIHGVQFTSPERQSQATTYYHENSGVGRTLRWFNRNHHRPLHVGAVGLGAGTIAVYGRPSDRYRFYEINPAVIDFAQEHFTFLADSRADVTMVPGDARLSLEDEPPQAFDVLVLDAFSGDAVPAHLLTREAMAIYLRHMRAGGVIAVHISNDYLNLRPVLVGLAEAYKLDWTLIDAPGDREDWRFTSQWILLTNNRELLASPEIAGVAQSPSADELEPLLWTDEFNNLLQILK